MKRIMLTIAFATIVIATAFTAESEKKVTVIMKEAPARFEPATLEIKAGTTVEWVNTGKKVHTVTGDDSDWDSGKLQPGKKFSKVFDENGTFKYHCIPHHGVGMIGTIVVK
jgi:plastocyanin